MTAPTKRRPRATTKGALYPRPHVARVAHLLARYRIGTSPRAAQRQIERAREVVTDLVRVAATDPETRAWMRRWLAPVAALVGEHGTGTIDQLAAADAAEDVARTRYLTDRADTARRQYLTALRQQAECSARALAALEVPR